MDTSKKFKCTSCRITQTIDNLVKDNMCNKCCFICDKNDKDFDKKIEEFVKPNTKINKKFYNGKKGKLCVYCTAWEGGKLGKSASTFMAYDECPCGYTENIRLCSSCDDLVYYLNGYNECENCDLKKKKNYETD